MSGFVVDITVTDGGTGYSDPPAVTINGGGGSGATAMATVSNSVVSRITVLTTGGGYTSTPDVVIAPPPPATGVPTLAIQLAPMLVVAGEPGSTARVSYAESTTPTQWIVITNVVLGPNGFVWGDPEARPGQRRYGAVSVPPNPSPNPRTAAGTVGVFNGFVDSVTVADGGEGYFSPPSVTFVGSGSGAAAAATLSNGVVTGVTVNTTGSGYSTASVVFSPPPPLTALTEYRVPQVTVRQDPPVNVLLFSTTALGQPDSWMPRANLVTSSNGVAWFDRTATQAISRFYRTGPVPPGMVLIPAGPFVMGDNFGDAGSYELPLHTNYVSSFYMDQYEVTKALWDGVYTWALGHGYSFEYGAQGKAANHPVQNVTWYDCVKWCNARSEKEGKTPAYYTSTGQTTVYRSGQVNVDNAWVKWNMGYRLPTEAEREKAARGGASGQRFPWGDTITWSQANYYAYPLSVDPDYGYPYDVNPTAGYYPTFATGGYPYTSPAGYFAPNGYGLYDMAGNVWEWCWDWYGSYSSASQTDLRGPTAGSNRVLRGGSWSDYAFNCRAAARNHDHPTIRDYYLGFRSVLAPGH